MFSDEDDAIFITQNTFSKDHDNDNESTDTDFFSSLQSLDLDIIPDAPYHPEISDISDEETDTALAQPSRHHDPVPDEIV